MKKGDVSIKWILGLALVIIILVIIIAFLFGDYKTSLENFVQTKIIPSFGG
ncbi:hypothetical protein GF374_02245 [Candidatus Woesearchaeota archaeon]|nr:hypothetical protein [Candidatus Woesearchaeota archaeon]